MGAELTDHLLTTYANSLDQDQAQQSKGPDDEADLDLYDTLMVILKEW